MNKHKLIYTFILALLLGMIAPIFYSGVPASALAPSNYTNYLIDNSTIRNSGTMSTSAIQTFLTNESSGLAGFSDVENCGSTSGAHYSYYKTYYSCGSTVSAAQIIYNASQAYGINPEVILATLQKEQSLITDPSPTSSQINCAMGYLSCTGDTGFFNQVDNATWQYRTYMELGTGNDWWGLTPANYPCANASKYYSTGLFPGNNVTFSDDNGTQYANITLPNMATAGLYCYTPYVYNNPSGLYGLPAYGYTGLYYSGSYNFVYYYDLWWGSTYSQDLLTGNPGSVSWGTGRIDIFARGQDGVLWQEYYDTSVGGWGGWAPLNVSISSPPTVSSWAVGRLDVFYVGSDGSLDHYWYANSSGGWQSVEELGTPPGVSIVGSPAAVSWGVGRIDVFIRGSDNQLWQKYYDGNNGGWQPWVDLGGAIVSSPTVTTWGPQRLDIFTMGPNGDLTHLWYDGNHGGWYPWESLGYPSSTVKVSSAPGAVAWGPGRIDVFIRGSDNALWQEWFDSSGWHPWVDLHGTINSAPTVSSWAPERLDIFSTGPSGDLQHYWFGGYWGNWESLGEPIG